MKPTILIDALTFHPRDGGFASALRDVLLSCRDIKEFDFVVAHDSRYKNYFKEFGLEQIGISIPGKIRLLASFFLLPYIVRRVHADAIHCETSAVPPFLPIPASVTVHDLYFLKETAPIRAKGWRYHQYWRNHIFLPSLHRAKTIKCISNATQKDVRDLVNKSFHTEIIYPRFSDPLKIVSPPLWPKKGDPLRILFIGSMVQRKNLPHLFKAMSMVQRPWTLDVVGNIWLSNHALGDALTDKRITIHNYVSDKEKDSLMDKSHLLVLPSLDEGFGYPAAEAMIRGHMVLTSDIEVFREYVPEPCRFNLNGPQHLAEKIDGLDEETYGRLRNACLKSVKKFPPQLHIEGHRQLFKALLG